jgi:sodium/hydrogen exchanger-like protein 3
MKEEMEIFQHFYAQSASMAQMDHGWNLDIGELAYSPSARDLSDAKVHHMLSEELWKPYRRVSLNSRGLNRMCRMYLP